MIKVQEGNQPKQQPSNKGDKQMQKAVNNMTYTNPNWLSEQFLNNGKSNILPARSNVVSSTTGSIRSNNQQSAIGIQYSVINEQSRKVESCNHIKLNNAGKHSENNKPNNNNHHNHFHSNQLKKGINNMSHVTTTNSPLKQLAIYSAIGLSALLAVSIFPEISLASKFDIDAGVKAATDPLIKGISDHWGKAVVLTGCAGAIIGEGDARQRAVRAAITSSAAGGVVMALLAMLT